MTQPPPSDFEHRSALLDQWLEKRREIARLEAEASSLLDERMRVFHEDVKNHPAHRDTIYRSLVSEYAAAGRVSKGTIEHALADAQSLNERYPAVQAAFAEGAISVQHVREIVRSGRIVHEAVRNKEISEETYALYEAAVLVVAENDTPARTRTHARQVASTLADQTLRERHASAAEERTVTLRSIEDGLVLLSIVLPEALGVAIFDRLTRMTTQIVRTRSEPIPTVAVHPDASTPADTAGDELLAVLHDISDIDDAAVLFDVAETIPSTIPDWMLNEADAEHRSTTDAAPSRDTRTFDQIRTDVLTDLLLASDPSEVHSTGLDSIQAHIQVTVAATTLAGLDEHLAELDGHGPLDPDVARELAGRRGSWTRLFLDSTGMVVETDTYSPTESMRRFLRARDQRCRFPGCHVPAARCDIDHNHDHAEGGATHICNLCHFCRGHHTLKHPDLRDEDRWTAQLAPDGSVIWRSPLGRDYLDHPPRRVMFV
ncbi:HNH endonuclease [Microbacterium sp. NIBRBAC000506063]|uniref:HNH endonuclease n=1 Tax=Microbacterium sp. NIBRBAC000506063 TaxID=2734618 RepID=UPI001BB7390B|nr:HNH endonuclease signature motif containing protein [Microbacterium sp. NIBRBAC000506063]QTV79756.1 DUF222 domain-containing protein [Microbacterium sp. NIBRBAC000506063]